MTQPATQTPPDNGKPWSLEKPNKFNGTQNKLAGVLIDCSQYMETYPETFKSDKQKIIFILSFMKEGPAEEWKIAFMDKVNKDINNPDYGTYQVFHSLLKKSFTPADSEGEALHKMKTLDMDTSESADEYVEKFKTWVT